MTGAAAGLRRTARRLRARLATDPRTLAGWLYGAWLTWRFVDEHWHFPAVVFPHGPIRLRVTKHPTARWVAAGPMVVAPWLGRTGCVVHLDPHALLDVQAELTIGPNVRLYAASGARLVLGGRDKETAAGFTADAVVMAHHELVVEADCIIGPGAYLTDCDWHLLEDGPATSATRIGRHTWIAHGASVLKGTTIGPDSVVAARSVVRGSFPAGSLLAGAPAQVRRPVGPWRRELPTEA